MSEAERAEERCRPADGTQRGSPTRRHACADGDESRPRLGSEAPHHHLHSAAAGDAGQRNKARKRNERHEA